MIIPNIIITNFNFVDFKKIEDSSNSTMGVKTNPETKRILLNRLKVLKTEFGTKISPIKHKIITYTIKMSDNRRMLIFSIKINHFYF